MTKLVAAALLLLSPVAFAGTDDAWRKRMDAIDAQLRAEDWTADAAAEALLAEIIDEVAGGPGEAGYLAYPMAQRAIARAGLGDRVGAQWWWWSAQQVLADIARFDLASFGDYGAAVASLGAAPAGVEVPASGAAWETDTGEIRTSVLRADATEPVPVTTSAAKRPSAQPPPEVSVSIRVIVDATGRFSEPVVLAPRPSPAFVAAALVSMATWTSRTTGSEPVPAVATLTFEASGTLRLPPLFPPSTAPLAKRAREARLETIAELVRTGQHAEARKKADALLNELLERGMSDATVGGMLAEMLVLRSIAESALGEDALSEWSWRAAHLLSREVARESVGTLGEAALALDRRYPEPLARPASEPAPIRTDITPPVLRKRVEPRYPLAAKRAGAKGLVVMELWIDTDGRVHLGRLLKADVPVSIIVAALEAVKAWEYAPALMAGEPQAVFLIVMVKFNLGAPTAAPRVRRP